jgi:hypothetical protein
MKNRQATKGAPCYFSALNTVIPPIDGVTLRLQAPYPFCGPEGSFGPVLNKTIPTTFLRVVTFGIWPPTHRASQRGLLDPYRHGYIYHL